MSVLLLASYTLLNDIWQSTLSLGKAGVPMHVSIRIKGHLDQSWQQWLEGLQMVHESDGTLRLSGRLQDQAALYGVLNKIDRLSLTLLSLERSETRPNED